MANPQQKSNRDHSFDSELASLVGIEKAILLKNISYWVDENERRKIESSFAYGKWWTFESLTSLAKKYPYMKRGNLSRWFKELKRDKWILMYNTTDGANMYTNGPVFNSWNLGQDWQGVFQNETGRKWGEVFQNEPKGGFQNETEAAAQNETHNNVESNIEKNVELEGEQEVKKTPPPTEQDFNKAIDAYVEAKKKKGINPVAPPPSFSAHTMDEYEDGEPWRRANPVLVESFDGQTLPGALIRTAEIIEPTNGTEITIQTGMNEAGETYIFEHTQRVSIPTGTTFERINMPATLDMRPNAQTPTQLVFAMVNFYKDWETEWKDGVLELARAKQYSEERRGEIMGLWACHTIKMNQGGNTYQQLNADLQKWFRGQKDFDRNYNTAQPKKSGTPNGYGGDPAKYFEKQKF